MEQERLTLSIEETAALTGLSSRTLYEMARTRRLPGAVRVNGRWLVLPDILTEWLRAQAEAQAAIPA